MYYIALTCIACGYILGVHHWMLALLNFREFYYADMQAMLYYNCIAVVKYVHGMWIYTLILTRQGNTFWDPPLCCNFYRDCCNANILAPRSYHHLPGTYTCWSHFSASRSSGAIEYTCKVPLLEDFWVAIHQAFPSDVQIRLELHPVRRESNHWTQDKRNQRSLSIERDNLNGVQSRPQSQRVSVSGDRTLTKRIAASGNEIERSPFIEAKE